MTKYIERTNIWKETIGIYKGKWVCQVFDEDYKCIIVSGDSFEEVANKVNELMYGNE